MTCAALVGWGFAIAWAAYWLFERIAEKLV